MIHLATYNTLYIARSTENGVYLTDADEMSEVLLPNRYVPENYEIGDSIEVFVYCDSEDREVATTERPKIILGEVASLKVVATTRIGAFLDWGLPKDLLVPFKNQLNPMVEGEYYPVAIYVDQTTFRIVGTSKIGHLVSNTQEITVKQKEEVEIVIAQRRNRGYRVIINGKHWGMLYDSQIFKPVALGEKYTAYVTGITEDLRIDVALQKQGLGQVKVATDVLMGLMQENGGSLPYGDRTPPEIIQANTGMSKKVFKRAAGFLLRQGLVKIEDDKITKIK
ncbi:MAG: S1-like domain-containing RNA-binding protein [Rikenellaceae bacterium]